MEVSTTLTFAPGETTRTVTVMTTEDEVNDPNEMFDAVLRNPSGADLGPNSRAVLTINDDDGKSHLLLY